VALDSLVVYLSLCRTGRFDRETNWRGADRWVKTGAFGTAFPHQEYVDKHLSPILNCTAESSEHVYKTLGPCVNFTAKFCCRFASLNNGPCYLIEPISLSSPLFVESFTAKHLRSPTTFVENLTGGIAAVFRDLATVVCA